MKYLLLLITLISSLANAQTAFVSGGATTWIGADYVEFNYHRSDSTGKIIESYPVRIVRNRKPVAYMNRDSTWVILDSAMTMNQLLKWLVFSQNRINYEVKQGIDRQELISEIYRKNYVVNKKKFDYKVAEIESARKKYMREVFNTISK